MQGSFLDVELAHKKKQTRRETFLAEMEALISWDALEAELVGHCPQGQKGRRPYPLAVMLRVHCLQLFYNLSDPGLEDALYEIALMRRFARISRLDDIPDETTILHFRNFLTNFSRSEKLFERINAVLAERGCKMSSGMIVDATILHAPSSTKNKHKARDPEMHQTKKGNQWYFGMKLHVSGREVIFFTPIGIILGFSLYILVDITAKTYKWLRKKMRKAEKYSVLKFLFH